MYLNSMKFNKKDIALAGTSGGTITLAALYGTSQTKQEEQKDEPQIETKEIIKEVEVVKDNPETLKELQREKAKNKELEGTIDSLTEENKRVNGELGKAEQKAKDLQDELTFERNWTNQLEGWRENDIEEKKSLKEALEDALRRLDEKDLTIEAIESEKTDIQSNASSLFNENSFLREQAAYLTTAYNSLSDSFSSYRDLMINALNKERNTIRIGEKPGCGYSNSQEDKKGTGGLNCEGLKAILPDGKEYTLDKFTAGATEKTNELWNYFKGRNDVYGDGKIETLKS